MGQLRMAGFRHGFLPVAAGVLLAVGMVSGLVPALRASKLDPVEALRYE